MCRHLYMKAILCVTSVCFWSSDEICGLTRHNLSISFSSGDLARTPLVGKCSV